MSDILMRRSLKQPISSISIPDGYSIVGVNEENGHLWEEVMDSSWGNHPKGSFRYVLVTNNYYDENRVFIMLNEHNEPIATATFFRNGHNWIENEKASLIFVGVRKNYQGKKLGTIMVDYVLERAKDTGFDEIEFITLFYPQSMGFNWDIEKHLRDELKSLRDCRCNGVLYLEASKVMLTNNYEMDNTRRRGFFNHYINNINPQKKDWFAKRVDPATDFLSIDGMTEEQVGNHVLEWVRSFQ